MWGCRGKGVVVRAFRKDSAFTFRLTDRRKNVWLVSMNRNFKLKFLLSFQIKISLFLEFNSRLMTDPGQLTCDLSENSTSD